MRIEIDFGVECSWSNLSRHWKQYLSTVLLFHFDLFGPNQLISLHYGHFSTLN